MYYFRSGTRMIQTVNNLKQGTYTLFCNQIDGQVEISSRAAGLLRKANKTKDFSGFYADDEQQNFLEELIHLGYIIMAEPGVYEEKNVYLAKKCTVNFPLTSLNIELTNACNLKCKHCYGAFQEPAEKSIIPLKWIQDSLQELNQLHVRNIALTGGESTLHPFFLEIVELLLAHGFNLCVFTNGYNPDVILRLLELTKEYRFTIKVSLDGFEETHNWIRGKGDAFEKVTKTLDAISKYPNVSLYISTVVLRKNASSIKSLNGFVHERYPNAIHTKDLAFPMGSACNELVFSLEEYNQFIDILRGTKKTKQENAPKMKTVQFRCSGGVSQCTLMPTGQMKICNAACDPQFYFKHNVYSKGILHAWKNCGIRIAKIRREKAKRTKNCKRCSIRKKCTINDCRVLAWIYTGEATHSNPLACMIEHDEKGDTAI